MNYKGTKHLFFDLDHTLWDFDLNSKLAYSQIFKEQKVALDIDTFIEIYEPLNLEFWRKYRNNEINKEQLRYQRLKTAFDACNYVISDTDIDLFADLYIEYLPNYNHLFEGCIEMLDHLSDSYEMHCITNGFQEIQSLKLERSQLAPYFKVVLTAEEACVKKPDPKIFFEAMDRAGAEIANSVMIGDSWEADILGARNIGMRTIYFNPLEKANLSLGQVNMLSQIQSLLVL